MEKRCITVYDSNISELGKHNFDEEPFFLFEGEIVDPGCSIIQPESCVIPAKFPDCCKWHRTLAANHLDWFNKFPNCCQPHKALAEKIWFRKESFNGLPYKIVRCVLFTTHHIHSVINNPSWYTDIVHFIEYALDSFGTPAIGSNLYLSDIKHYVKHIKSPSIPKEKRKLIIDYINSQNNQEIVSPPDLNLLYNTFQKWINSLPELNIFSKFKLNNANKIPQQVLFYESDYNPYLNQTRFRVRTKGQLVKLLVTTTKNSLANVNSSKLLEEGIISDVSKHQFDIIGGKRKLKQDKLLGRYSKGELKYVDVMKKWLANEEEYFAGVSTLLEKSNILPALPRIDKIANEATYITNNFDLGSNASIHMAQGTNANQTNISGDNAQVEVSPPVA